MHRTDRLYRILKMLEQTKHVSRETFLQRLDISLATLKRDLDHLRSQQHAPIVWDAMERAYTLDLGTTNQKSTIPGTWLDRREWIALVAIERIAEQLEPKILRDVLAPIRERSASVIAAADDDNVRVAEAIKRIKVLPMHRRVVPEVVFENAVSALIERRQLSIASINRVSRVRTDRIVSPQHLVSYRDNWYLDTWCHLRQGLRTFALDTIARASVRKEPAIEVPEPEAREHFAASYGIFSGAAENLAVLRFEPSVSGWIEREQWHPQQTMRRLSDGAVELRIPYGNPTELIRDVLRWGPDVEVITPEALRTEVAERVTRMGERYKKVKGWLTR